MSPDQPLPWRVLHGDPDATYVDNDGKNERTTPRTRRARASPTRAGCRRSSSVWSASPATCWQPGPVPAARARRRTWRVNLAGLSRRGPPCSPVQGERARSIHRPTAGCGCSRRPDPAGLRTSFSRWTPHAAGSRSGSLTTVAVDTSGSGWVSGTTTTGRPVLWPIEAAGRSAPRTCLESSVRRPREPRR